MRPPFSNVLILAGLAISLGCGLPGCASGHYRVVDADDPHEHFNRKMDRLNDSLDRHFLKPASDAYVKVTPQPVRDCLHNAFGNLTYFDTIFNECLQGKADPASHDMVRWSINSTFGLAGLFDWATPLHLPQHDQDFGLTLGIWGVPQKPYLVLPFVGPTTERDMWSIPMSVVTDPLTWVGDWWQTLPVDAVRVVDFRASVENEVRFRNQAALDPYVFTREAYLQYRQNQLNNAAANTQPTMDYFENEDTTQPATAPATKPAAK